MKKTYEKYLDTKGKKTLKIGILLILLFFGLWYIEKLLGFFVTTYAIFRPVVYGLVIAFIINLPMNFFQEKVFGKIFDKRKYKKLIMALSLVLSWIVFFAIITVILTVLIPELATAIESLVENIPIFMDKLIEYLGDNVYFRQASLYISQQLSRVNPESVALGIRNIVSGGSSGLLNTTSSILNSLSSAIVALVMGFIFSIYVSLNKKDLKENTNKVLFANFSQKKVEDINYLAKLSYISFARFLETRLLSCLSLGIITYIGMKILSLPMAGMISILVGAFDFIPYFGPIIATGIGMILIFIQSPIQSLVFLVYVLIIQQIQEQIVFPLVIGKHQGLPAIWIFLSVLLGGRLFGIVGMITFMPLATIVYTLAEDKTRRKLRDKNIGDEEIKSLGDKSFEKMREEKFD
ncbi:MAG: AI-2E family transporter [Anaerococcus sp.]|nr:AI-2E family transporter [Anaerococcus sp.]